MCRTARHREMLVDAAGDGTPHRAVLAPEFGQDRCRSVLCDSLLPALAAAPRAACARITAQSSSATRHAAPIITSHYSSRRFSMHQALGTDPGTLQAGRAPPPLGIYTHLVDAARPPGQPSATRQHTHSYTLYPTDARTRTTHHAQPELRAQRPANTIASIRTDEYRDTPAPRSPGAARVSMQVRVAAPAAQCTDGCSCAAAHAHAAGSAHAPDARGAALGTGRRSKWAVSCLRTAAKAPVSAGVQDPRRPAPSSPKMGIAALLRVDDRAAAAGDG